MTVLRLAWQSLRNRWLTALLTVLAIAVSVAKTRAYGFERLRVVTMGGQHKAKTFYSGFAFSS